MRKREIHYYSHRGRRKHPSSVVYHLGSLVLPLALVVLASFAAFGVVLAPAELVRTSSHLLAALGLSLLRLFGAYLLALVVGIPLGLLAEANRHVEAALLPVFDVLESMPVLAFFPVIIVFFVHAGWLEGAALFIIFFSMVWNIAFSTVGGLKVIPEDVKAVGKVFGLSPLARLTRITLPALFPPLVTGSILSLADGWNVLIVAEALHAYAPASAGASDLFGIGSILVSSSTQANTPELLTAMGMLVLVIAVINLFVWQPLLARAEQFKFE
ncbi:MAG: sulfonate transporter permease [Parcubacteria group bacterium]|nr:sulfonate transporter permease [Parcubacteria group bacterium]